MNQKLQALGLRNYRGIGPEWQFMPKLEKFNFFIGANNSGKSAVLNFLSKQLGGGISAVSSNNISPLEKFDGGTKGPVSYAFGFSSAEATTNVLSAVKNEAQRPTHEPLVRAIVERLSVNGVLWIGGAVQNKSNLNFLADHSFSNVGSVVNQIQWRRLWESIQNSTGGGFEQHWFPQTMELVLSSQKISLPKVHLIPAKRQIGPKGQGFEDYSGEGLIDRLAEAQSPDWDRREDRHLFDKINRFVKQVTGDNSAQIEIPHNREQILVHMGGRVLPLPSLGTGIHEVILIAAFCTLSQEEIVCIEEPEIHLHPLMQRRLMRFLEQDTDNQYFIATHSASFIDTKGAAIFHVTHGGDQVRIRETILARDRYEICADLGCRASDIVQSNAVIWVEGPSDRIYLKRWISEIDPNLVEGIHYSIMFYGGRLLSHLTAEADDIEEFISLLPLNRNAAIIMDSDKRSLRATINSTKQRVKEAFSKSGGVAWITAGREIENYVDPNTVSRCLAAAYPSKFSSTLATGRFDHVLPFKEKTTPSKGTRKPQKVMTGVFINVDKVKLAKLIVQQPVDLSRFDLRPRVRELVSLIQKANHE